MHSNKPLTALLIDDEPDSRIALRKLLEFNCPHVQVIGEADGVANALTMVKQTTPELLLLDIRIADGTGFDLLNQLQTESHKYKVVFITGYDQYAVKAFKYLAIDYLLKPVDPDELEAAIDKVTGALHYDALQNSAYQKLSRKREADSLVIAGLKNHKVLRFKDIGSLQANGSYVFFNMMDSTQHLASHSISHYEQFLPASLFVRTHRSWLVNLEQIGELKGTEIRLRNGALVPVSVRKRPAIMKLLRDR